MHCVIIPISCEIFLFFPNFPRFSSCLATREATRHIPFFVQIIHFFSLVVKRKFGKVPKKSQNIMPMIVRNKSWKSNKVNFKT